MSASLHHYRKKRQDKKTYSYHLCSFQAVVWSEINWSCARRLQAALQKTFLFTLSPKPLLRAMLMDAIVSAHMCLCSQLRPWPLSSWATSPFPTGSRVRAPMTSARSIPLCKCGNTQVFSLGVSEHQLPWAHRHHPHLSPL